MPSIIFIGSSHVNRFEEHLIRHDPKLPFPIITKGKSGLRLGGLVSMIQNNLSVQGSGYVLFQVGGNDIGALSEVEWMRLLSESVHYVLANYPKFRLIWSDMPLRTRWRYKTRRLQRKARGLFHQVGGFVIKHPGLNTSHLCSDGVHLNRQGNAVLLSDFEQFFWGLVSVNV